MLPSIPLLLIFLYLCLLFTNYLCNKYTNMLSMINKTLLSLLLLLAVVTVTAQKKSNIVCRPGFTYALSNSIHWGLNKPVITGIVPYSSAESSGLKLNDIIESVDGIPVNELTAMEISQLLNNETKDEIILTVRNLSSEGKQLMIHKDCKLSKAITEDQLALAFNMYSLESTSEREFICPFKTTTTREEISFDTYKTFGFAPIDENNSKLENFINQRIEKELVKKGLTYNASNPDLLIQTYYFFDKNPNYTGAVTNGAQPAEKTFRYFAASGKMIELPFLSVGSVESKAPYLLQFGFRFIDQKVLHGQVVWECESNELLTESYRLDDYAAIHIPLMCLQYPFVKYTRNVPVKVDVKNYNYTGISYDINRLERIAEVEPGSPAEAAGIKAGDVIERIGNQKMNYSSDEFTSAYKQFITLTMDLRDPATQFTDANGFSRCMYWNVMNYPKIADFFKNPSNITGFSYLYNFTPYVNPVGTNVTTFLIKRGKDKEEITIRPTVRTETSVYVN